MSEEIEEILSYLKEEALSDKLLENFSKILDKIDHLIEINYQKHQETREELTKRLLEREREILYEIKKVIQLIRLEKIIRLSLEETKIENITSEEEEILQLIKQESRRQRREGGKGIIAVALKDIPAFVGTKGLEYGPFKSGDVIKINEDDMRILIKRGLVKVVGEYEDS